MRKIALTIFSLSFIFGIFFTPVSFVSAQSAAQVLENDFQSKLGVCQVPELRVESCFVLGFYHIIFRPSAWFAELSGRLFDYFLAYSIDTGSYTGTNNTFVERGWSVIRDIANITFIFALLYVAISHILNLTSSKTKKFLVDIIIAALFINFSLFFTKVIIDGGNILARAFYNNIQVVSDSNPNINQNLGYKTLSEGIVSHVSPQKILSSDLFRPISAQGRPPGEVSAGWSFLMMALVTAVNVILGITFISVFLLFAARVIGLWFMMIFSPIAFASIAIPGGKGFLGRFGMGKWLKETVSLSFMAPVFIFFLFLLIMFLEIITTTPYVPQDQQSYIQQLMPIVIPFIAVIIILNMAKKQAKDMAGEVGSQVTSFAAKVAGAGVGVAGLGIGGAALALRLGIGSAASAANRSKRFRKWTSSKSQSNNRFVRAGGNLLRRAADTATRKGATASFDPRNTGLGKRTSSLLSNVVSQSVGGQKLNTNIFGYDATKGRGAGGYQQMREDREEKAKKKAAAADMDYKDSATYRRLERDLEDAKRSGDANRIATAQAALDVEKNEIDNLNQRRRESQAWWQGNALAWQPGSQMAADAVLLKKKPKSEMEKLLKEIKKSMKEEEGSNQQNNAGGGPQSGQNYNPPPSGSGGPSSGPTSSSSGLGDIKSAIDKQTDTIKREGVLEKRRDTAAMYASKSEGGAPGSFGTVINLNSKGTSGDDARPEIGFRRSSQSSEPESSNTETSRPIGFRRPSESDEDKS